MKIELSLSYQNMPVFLQKKCFHRVFVLIFSLFQSYFCCCVFRICAGSYAPARGNETLHERKFLDSFVLFTCSVRVIFLDLDL